MCAREETQELVQEETQKIDLEEAQELEQKRLQEVQEKELRDQKLEAQRIQEAKEKEQRAQKLLEQKRLQEAREKEQRDQKLEAQRIQEEALRIQEAKEKAQRDQELLDLKKIQEAKEKELRDQAVQKLTQRIQEARRLQEENRIAKEKAQQQRRIDQEFIEGLPLITSKGLLHKIQTEHRRLIPIDKSTNDSLAEIQLSGHETERYIEQCTLEQINCQKDIIGTVINKLRYRLAYYQDEWLFIFLKRMKTFNFFEFIGEDHQFDPDIAKNYVSDPFKMCNILCDRYHILTYETIQLDFINVNNVNLAIALKNLRNFLGIIHEKSFFYFPDILTYARKHCYMFFNNIPKLRNWYTKNNEPALKGEFTMIEIQHSVVVRFYCVGGMNSAVIRWQSILKTSFEPKRVCRAFDILVVLGRLHLSNVDNINKLDMMDRPNMIEITDIQKSLYFAKKFVEIYEGLQEGITVHERAELILSQLKTKVQMDVPQMDVDLFRLPYRESIGYYFTSIGLRSPLDYVIINILPHFHWSGSADSSQLHFIARDNGYLKCFAFDINKFKKNIADLSKFIIAVQKVRRYNYQKSAIAAEAILRVNEILTNAFDEDQINLKYLQDKLPEINETLFYVGDNDRIVANVNYIIKTIISILDPLRALGVKLPIWKKEKFIVEYKDGITGDICYKSYSASDGALIEATDMIQPRSNWYNNEGDFDVDALNRQVQQIHTLAMNVKFLKGRYLTADVVYIINTFEQLYISLGYRNLFTTNEICKDIVNIFSEPNNKSMKIMQLAREIFPLVSSDRRTPWHNSHRLPFHRLPEPKNSNTKKNIDKLPEHL